MAEDAPISNSQLHDYLAAQSLAHTTPSGENYVGPDAAHLHRESYNLLLGQVQASAGPLMRPEGDGHRLASEALESGTQVFHSMLAEDMRTLRAGLNDPRKARAAIQDSYAKGGGTPPLAAYSDRLSLKEVAEYLEVLAEQLPDNPERALHADSLRLLGRLVDRWRDSQHEPGQPEFTDSVGVSLSAPLPGSRKGAQSIEMFLTEQRKHFEKITAEKIVMLGQAALNPHVVRQQAAAHAAKQSTGSASSPGRPTTPLDDDAVEAARKLVDVDANPATSPSERHETPRVVAETIEAARGTAIMHLDVPKGVRIAHKYGPETSHTAGFKTFGDGDEGGPRSNEKLPDHMMMPVGSRNPLRDPEGRPITDIVEGWGFTPTEDGSGDEFFDYAYNSQWARESSDYPAYTESSGRRSGGMFIFRVRLSHERAESFRQAVLPDSNAELSPDQREWDGVKKTAIVREFAHQVVVRLGANQEGADLMEKAWSTGGVGDRGDSNPMRPPYDKLPARHRPFIIRPRSQTGASYETAEPLW